MDLVQNHINSRFFRYCGLLLLILAFIVWINTIIQILSNEVMLLHAQTINLEVEEIWAYAGSLKWWENVYETSTIPLTGILVTSGIAAILVPNFIRYRQTIALKKLRNKDETIKLDRFLRAKEN